MLPQVRNQQWQQRDTEQRKDELALEIKNAQKELKEKEDEYRKKILDAVLKEAPDAARKDLQAALETAAAKRTGAADISGSLAPTNDVAGLTIGSLPTIVPVTVVPNPSITQSREE